MWVLTTRESHYVETMSCLQNLYLEVCTKAVMWLNLCWESLSQFSVIYTVLHLSSVSVCWSFTHSTGTETSWCIRVHLLNSSIYIQMATEVAQSRRVVFLFFFLLKYVSLHLSLLFIAALQHPVHFSIDRFNHKSPTAFYSVLNVNINNISNNAVG